MAKSLCRLLIKVNHALVANFQCRKNVFQRYSRKKSCENFRIYSIYNLKEYRNMYKCYKVIYDVNYIPMHIKTLYITIYTIT